MHGDAVHAGAMHVDAVHADAVHADPARLDAMHAAGPRQPKRRKQKQWLLLPRPLPQRRLRGGAEEAEEAAAMQAAMAAAEAAEAEEARAAAEAAEAADAAAAAVAAEEAGTPRPGPTHAGAIGGGGGGSSSTPSGGAAQRGGRPQTSLLRHAQQVAGKWGLRSRTAPSVGRAAPGTLRSY